VVVLAERDCDATTLYRTREDSFELGPAITTCSIETFLRAMARAFGPHWSDPGLSYSDRELISWAIAGLWARQSWEPWLRVNALVRGLLPAWAAQATSYVA
jgi:hypothetical protein